MDVRLQMMRGSVQSLKRINGTWDPQVHGVLGITESHWEVLTSPVPWTPAQAREARVTLESTIYGAIQIAGLPAFTLPVEFVATVIVLIIEGVNWMTACSWNFQTFEAEKIVSGPGADADVVEHCTPKRLFAEVLYAHDNLELEPAVAVDSPARGGSHAQT